MVKKHFAVNCQTYQQGKKAEDARWNSRVNLALRMQIRNA